MLYIQIETRHNAQINKKRERERKEGIHSMNVYIYKYFADVPFSEETAFELYLERVSHN